MSGADCLQPGLRLQDTWRNDEDVFALATNSVIFDLLSQLYGGQAWPFQTLNFPMGTQQHYHTDIVHFSSVPECFMCGVWVALEDIGLDQGPVEYYPGSHKWPIYSNEHIGRINVGNTNSTQEAFHRMWEAMVAGSKVQREIFCARKGQAVIWSANLLHGGTKHLNKAKTRWSQVTHYYFDDCAYYTPLHSDPFRGLISFRAPVNILTGAKVEVAFSGRCVPRSFIEAASNGFGEIKRDKFDGEAYLLANPDVFEAGVDPWWHYINCGHKEGRFFWPKKKKFG